MIGGFQKLSKILLIQKSLLCKLGLRGDKCGGNFNKFNAFVNGSTSNYCVGKSSKQGDELKEHNGYSKRETLIQKELDINTLIRKGLCAPIVAKKVMLSQNGKDNYWWIMV